MRKVPQDRLVDELFKEIDKSLAAGRVETDDEKAAEAAKWLQRIEDENADELTPERIALMEAAGTRESADEVLEGANGDASKAAKAAKAAKPPAEAVSGRRFQRAR